MQAIILASGLGKRLLPLTKKIPKPLIKINKKTILERIIDSLIKNGIKDFIITTGYLEEEIKSFVQKKYPNLKVTYVKNPKYATTNAIYSLWLTHNAIKGEDAILMHSDLIYDPDLISGIIKSQKSSALIQKVGALPPKDFKARIKNNLVEKISVDVKGKDAFFCAPIYKFTKKDFKRLFQEIDKFITKGKTDCYAEEAFNKIPNQIKLYPVYYQNRLCMEIDDFEDLTKAKRILEN